MINTLNESQLHKALKTFYAVQFSAQEEVKVERWYCDLVCPDGGIVEIQTKNVGALKEKIAGLLKSGRRVTVVHPIIKEKIIETYSEDGTLASRRKSPKKESLWSELREFTALTEILLQKKFSLLLPEITMAEKRIQSPEAQQAKNGRRRYKKAWQKTDKALLTIGATYKMNGKKDWLGLLPKEILEAAKAPAKKAVRKAAKPVDGAGPAKSADGQPQPFCAATIREIYLKEKNCAAAQNANLILWLLRKAGLIVRVPHPGRGFFYVWSRHASL